LSVNPARAAVVLTTNRPTVSKIEVPYHDEAYEMLISWVCSQPFAQSARASLVKVDHKSSADVNGPIKKKPLHYSPCNGRSFFWHNGRLFMFTRNRTQEQFGFTREEVTLSYFGRNPKVLRELFSECRRHYMRLVENKICVFEHQGDAWKLSKSRSKRDIATVVIKKETKKMLLDDVADFLNPQTRSWYCTRSLPYQRGYLFYGLPGTGKSSFSISIAGLFGLDLYVLSIPSLSDQSLKTLFADLPQQCVVLLEDVDAVGLTREQDADMDASPGGNPRKSDKKVSLSTVLNVLDGIGSSEGRVLIVTTNHIERLDPALIRPGRVDMKVEFQLADRDMINQLFFFIYGPKPSNDVNYNESRSSISQGEKDCVVQNGELHQLAQEFAAKIPESEFSPAEIMSFLLANKHSPVRAVAGVGDWMERNREEGKRALRTNSWALDANDESDDN